MTNIVYKTIRYEGRTANYGGGALRRTRSVIDWHATIVQAIESDGEFTCGIKNKAAQRIANAMVKDGTLVHCGMAPSRFVGIGMQYVYRAA